VTQRNASAAEELASTAEEMAAQAKTLEHLVAFFRVGTVALPSSGSSWLTSPLPSERPSPAWPADRIDHLSMAQPDRMSRH
jgi:methyl-accepting chemotaxis protein